MTVITAFHMTTINPASKYSDQYGRPLPTQTCLAGEVVIKRTGT